MSSVTLAQAETIADAAFAKGHETQCAPLTVVVLDAGGHVVLAKRQDKSGIMRFEIARGKAYGALGMGVGSRELSMRAPNVPHFINALAAVSDGRMVPVPGGVLVQDADGTVIGAVGVSGDTSDRDEVCVIAGIEAARLQPNTGAT